MVNGFHQMFYLPCWGKKFSEVCWTHFQDFGCYLTEKLSIWRKVFSSQLVRGKNKEKTEISGVFLSAPPVRFKKSQLVINMGPVLDGDPTFLNHHNIFQAIICLLYFSCILEPNGQQ